jgi:hypothetical protein
MDVPMPGWRRHMMRSGADSGRSDQHSAKVARRRAASQTYPGDASTVAARARGAGAQGTLSSQARPSEAATEQIACSASRRTMAASALRRGQMSWRWEEVEEASDGQGGNDRGRSSRRLSRGRPGPAALALAPCPRSPALFPLQLRGIYFPVRTFRPAQSSERGRLLVAIQLA